MPARSFASLLEFSRSQSSEMQTFHIDYVIHRTTELISNALHIHKIELVKDLPETLPLVNGDLQKLQQVFLNLIINAEQALGEGGTITVRARVMENGYVRTDVIDNGPGIAPEIWNRSLTPFSPPRRLARVLGWACPLPMAIVRKHGGYIEVKSTLGKGTTFSVYLPILQRTSEWSTEQ